ncbi:MAG: HNH endonuclease [Methylocella sp.]
MPGPIHCVLVSESLQSGRATTADPYYGTPGWRALRRAALARDGGICVTPGCGRPATIVDHIKSRRAGGADTLGNVRSFCSVCDNKVKEDHCGNRRNGGIVSVTGIDGWPVHR